MKRLLTLTTTEDLKKQRFYPLLALISSSDRKLCLLRSEGNQLSPCSILMVLRLVWSAWVTWTQSSTIKFKVISCSNRIPFPDVLLLQKITDLLGAGEEIVEMREMMEFMQRQLNALRGVEKELVDKEFKGVRDEIKRSAKEILHYCQAF